MAEHPHTSTDDHHHFVTGKPMLVCGNTADMISRTRLTRHTSASSATRACTTACSIAALRR